MRVVKLGPGLTPAVAWKSFSTDRYLSEWEEGYIYVR